MPVSNLSKNYVFITQLAQGQAKIIVKLPKIFKRSFNKVLFTHSKLSNQENYKEINPKLKFLTKIVE